MIAILDYSVGNLRSVQKGFEHAGVADVIVTSNPADIGRAEGLVLPGVGAFRDAKRCLVDSGLQPVLEQAVAEGKPLLGICLGMQLLLDESLEHGHHRGLGLVSGACRPFGADRGVKVPHIGWNTVSYPQKSPLFAGIPEETAFYFVHSYYCDLNSDLNRIGITEYGGPYTSALWAENVFGVQFHPEKSSLAGRKMLQNFAQIVAGGW